MPYRAPLLAALLLACAPGLASCCFFPGADRCGAARDDAKRAWAAYELDLQQRASLVATQLQLAEAAASETARLDARLEPLEPARGFLFPGCRNGADGRPRPPASPAAAALLDAMQRERQRACGAYDLIRSTAATRSSAEAFDFRLGPQFMECPEDHVTISKRCADDARGISDEFNVLLQSTRALRVNVDSGTSPETLLQMSRTGRVESSENPLRTAAVTALETLRDRCK